mmetsp:Transcript_49443/g.159612  ORF Transcript_49443/g.159612 Transcript_49443/m.159612 type:complete len:226 (+) Transcript_49443:242-919(+)
MCWLENSSPEPALEFACRAIADPLWRNQSLHKRWHPASMLTRGIPRCESRPARRVRISSPCHRSSDLDVNRDLLGDFVDGGQEVELLVAPGEPAACLHREPVQHGPAHGQRRRGATADAEGDVEAGRMQRRALQLQPQHPALGALLLDQHSCVSDAVRLHEPVADGDSTLGVLVIPLLDEATSDARDAPRLTLMLRQVDTETRSIRLVEYDLELLFCIPVSGTVR